VRAAPAIDKQRRRISSRAGAVRLHLAFDGVAALLACYGRRRKYSADAAFFKNACAALERGAASCITDATMVCASTAQACAISAKALGVEPMVVFGESCNNAGTSGKIDGA